MSHDHSNCCRGANCGHCGCCEIRITKAANGTRTRDRYDNGRGPDAPVARCWVCIVLAVLLALLALSTAIAFYRYWDQQQIPLFHPKWCDPQFGQETSSLTGSGTSSVFEPAIPSTKSLIPTVSVTAVRLPAQAFGAGAPSRTASAGNSITTPIPPNAHIDPENLNRAARLAIAEADGSPIAGPLLSGLSKTTDENAALPNEVIEISEGEGVLGFHRLGQVLLGKTAFEIAQASPRDKRLYVPFCPKAIFMPYSPPESYKYFTFITKECSITGKPDNVQQWLDAMKLRFPEYAPDFSTIDTNSHDLFSDLVAQFKLDPELPENRDRVCKGIPRIKDGGWGKPTCEFATRARQALKLGDAALANGEIDRARACWRKAISLTQSDPENANPDSFDPDGVPSSIVAQQRLQNYGSTCKWTPESLARISRDHKAYSGDLLPVQVLQRALSALGHYEGDFDGELSPRTRAAIRKFQRQREEDETDTLTPLQTTLLVCNAAETPGDSYSKNTLGLMYGAGLGVEQNTDQALQWLNDAANRKQPDATYNLAILYGTGIILNSYRLCDVPRTPEQADKYLQEAARLGHPRALELMSIYGPHSTFGSLTPRERWALIEYQQFDKDRGATGRYASRLANIGTSCAPDRSIR